jgi:hypothetical protein
VPLVLLKTQFTKLAATCEEDCDCDDSEEQPVEYDGTDGHPVYEAHEDADCAEEDGCGCDLYVTFEGRGGHYGVLMESSWYLDGWYIGYVDVINESLNVTTHLHSRME